MTALLTYAATDVNRDLAIRAYSGTSFEPERRARQVEHDYLEHMRFVEAEFAPYATADNQDALAADLEGYRQGYLKRLTAYLGAHSRVVSTFISGPSGFPTRQMEKRNDTVDKRRAEFIDWRTAALDKLYNRYDPRRIARRPINASDDDAVERLQHKLDKAIALQERMKLANKVCRSASLTEAEKTERLTEMGYSITVIAAMLHPEYGPQGHQSWELSNNNASIKRMAERIAALTQEKQRQPMDDSEALILGESVTISENTADNRIQLFFTGKPPEAVRDLLKSRGFKWAPSQGAWQRQLSDNARQAVLAMVVLR